MRISALAVTALSLLCPPGPVAGAVLRVVTLETTDVAAYVKEVERGNALLKKGGSSASMRVWRGQFAGADAGKLVVQLEYPDLAALARDNEKFSKDPEMQSWLKSVERLRKVLSDSVYQELRP
jgi:hypothetical protein